MALFPQAIYNEYSSKLNNYNTIMKIGDNLPVLSFENQQSWDAWLAENHRDSKGIWMKIAKKESGVASIYYPQALDSALCYGWIDGQKASFDESSWLQKFSPRGPRSVWSKINCAKAQALIDQGKMHPAGLEQVELAKADGRWVSAYDSQSKITVPPDFQKELDKNIEARDFFTALDKINRYAILHRIQTAKKAETRLARINKYIEMLSNHQKIHP